MRKTNKKHIPFKVNLYIMEETKTDPQPPLKKLKLNTAMRKLRQLLENDICGQYGAFKEDKDGRIIISKHALQNKK